MHSNPLIGSVAASALCLLSIELGSTSAVRASEELKYPDLRGEWVGTGGNRWPVGVAPLTPEYQAIFDANTRDQLSGGQGDTPTVTCLPPGMPRQMNVYEPMEIIVTPQTTHMLVEHVHDSRRIYTDGRAWPAELEPSFRGTSIGTWSDADRDGVYDTLVVETRGLKGPRTFDSSGIPMHKDNRTVVKERIVLDSADKNLIHNEITTIDNALTRPWTITKNYRRLASSGPIFWRESICAENNPHVRIGSEIYYVGADGNLMPTKKDQPPPDLKYFKQTRP